MLNEILERHKKIKYDINHTLHYHTLLWSLTKYFKKITFDSERRGCTYVSVHICGT